MAYSPFSRVAPLSRASSRFNVNQSGGTLPKGTPVKITPSGLSLVDVSVESDVDALGGVLAEDSTNNSNGTVISSGTIEDITTAFAVGSAIYISKTGLLTNVKPTIGVNGFGANDFAIKIGMIAKNANDPLKKDLLVGVQIIGML